MEQFHPEHEQQGPERALRLNLNRERPFETIRKAINGALAMLEGEELQDFKYILEWANTPESGKGYDDILAIINAHIGGRLVDTSGTHPEYAGGVQDKAEFQALELSSEQPQSGRLSDRWYEVGNTQRLDGNGFFVSYNEHTNQLTSFPVLDKLVAGEEPRETALCHEADTLILTGDWRQQYEDRIDQGFDVCYQFYLSMKHTYGSIWSSDYGNEEESDGS